MAKVRNVTRRGKLILTWAGGLAVGNFLAFVAGSFALGGDATAGYVRDGRHFVCMHGACREVSEAVWTYSWWHSQTAWVGACLLLLVYGLLLHTGEIELEPSRPRGA